VYFETHVRRSGPFDYTYTNVTSPEERTTDVRTSYAGRQVGEADSVATPCVVTGTENERKFIWKEKL
jgi:hypothetical protein